MPTEKPVRVEIQGRWLGPFYNFSYHLLIDGEYITFAQLEENLLGRAKFLAGKLGVEVVHVTHADPQPEGFKPYEVNL